VSRTVASAHLWNEKSTEKQCYLTNKEDDKKLEKSQSCKSMYFQYKVNFCKQKG